MASTIQQFLKEHGISEVEAIIPDMAGVARGKLMPAEKFAEEEGMRLPEAIFLQTVTGDYRPISTSSSKPIRRRCAWCRGRPSRRRRSSTIASTATAGR
jgi:glutamine synthetase